MRPTLPWKSLLALLCLVFALMGWSTGALAESLVDEEGNAEDNTLDEGVSTPATHGQTAEFFRPPPPRATFASITLSLVEFLEPVAEFTGEVKLDSKNSGALIFGFGKIDPPSTYAIKFEPVLALNLGAQWRHYFHGRFEQGFHAGLEGLYYYRDVGVVEMNGEPIYEVESSAVAVGPMVGGKQVFESGVTLDASIGFYYVVALGEISDAQGNKLGEATDEGITGLVNINIGWTL